MPITSEYIRSEVVQALRLDLIRPVNSHAFAHALLSDPCSRYDHVGFRIKLV